jgi:hypothetical protein
VSDVYCPIHQHKISNWWSAEPYQIGTDAVAQRVTRDSGETEESWQSRLSLAYRPCADPAQPGAHFLPWDYADYSPVTIGMIGHSGAGKTHLLAAMIYQLLSLDTYLLERVGIHRVGPLDVRAHQRFEAECVTPLIVHRRELGGTRAGTVEFCDALKVTNDRGRSFAVTFFDLAGETLEGRRNQEARFYAGANALIFVVDAASLPRRRSQGSAGDATFTVALKRMESRPGPTAARGFIPVAAAVVVAKADLVEFQDVLPGDWLAAGSPYEETDLSTVEQESEDAFVFLTRRGATRWLGPAQDCHHSTLHFASATNGPAIEQAFPPSFRPRRVLKPLLSVFAMIGIIDGALLHPHPAERQ